MTYDILISKGKTTETENRSVVGRSQGPREFGDVRELFLILIMAVVLRVYASVKTHRLTPPPPKVNFTACESIINF